MKNITLAVLLSVLLGRVGMIAAAQELSPERFVRADIAAREATLAGMEARLTLWQRGVDEKRQARLEADIQNQVAAVFARYHTTGPAHPAYGSRYSDAILAWLADHPDWQRRYDELAARFEALSRQLEALSRGN